MSDLNIIVVPYRNWTIAQEKGIYGRDLHLINELSQHSGVKKVLVIQRPVSLVERWLRQRQWLCQGDELMTDRNYILVRTKDYPKLHVLCSKTNSFLGPIWRQRIWWDDMYKEVSFRKHVLDAVQHLEMKNNALFIMTPFTPSALSTVPHVIAAFDLFDDFSSHSRLSNKEKKFCLRSYREIGLRADVITCTTSGLRDIFRDSSCRVVQIPNGVSREWLELTPAMPRDLADIPKPVVGFVGTIFETFHESFVECVARALPNVSFVFVGPISGKRISKRLRRLSNVNFIGAHHYADIPAYYYHFDLTVIPHIAEKGHFRDSIKLYESLSLGTPVISLPWLFDDVGVNRKADNDCVRIVQSTQECVNAVTAILNVPRDERRRRCRTKLVVEDFWDWKAEQIVRLFEEIINER